MFKSKKIFYCLIGLFAGTVTYGLNLYLITLFPASMSGYLSLANIYFSFLAGIVSLGVGSHTFMDYKTMNTNINSVITDVASVTKTLLNVKREPKDFQVALEELGK